MIGGRKGNCDRASGLSINCQGPRPGPPALTAGQVVGRCVLVLCCFTAGVIFFFLRGAPLCSLGMGSLAEGTGCLFLSVCTS
jgi:hypothetical protein